MSNLKFLRTMFTSSGMNCTTQARKSSWQERRLRVCPRPRGQRRVARFVPSAEGLGRMNRNIAGCSLRPVEFRLLAAPVHECSGQSVQLLDTLPAKALYLLAAPSMPSSAAWARVARCGPLPLPRRTPTRPSPRRYHLCLLRHYQHRHASAR